MSNQSITRNAVRLKSNKIITCKSAGTRRDQRGPQSHKRPHPLKLTKSQANGVQSFIKQQSCILAPFFQPRHGRKPSQGQTSSVCLEYPCLKQSWRFARLPCGVITSCELYTRGSLGREYVSTSPNVRGSRNGSCRCNVATGTNGQVCRGVHCNRTWGSLG